MLVPSIKTVYILAVSACLSFFLSRTQLVDYALSFSVWYIQSVYSTTLYMLRDWAHLLSVLNVCGSQSGRQRVIEMLCVSECRRYCMDNNKNGNGNGSNNNRVRKSANANVRVRDRSKRRKRRNSKRGRMRMGMGMSESEKTNEKAISKLLSHWHHVLSHYCDTHTQCYLLVCLLVRKLL